MPTYSYKAKTQDGELQKGRIEAPSKEEVIAKIDSLGLFPVSIEERKFFLRMRPKVSLKELVEFTYQLSTLVNSGSPLLSSLITLTSQAEFTTLRTIILDIISRIKEGQDFSGSLQEYSHVFPGLYISLVRVGETSGTLGKNLKHIAEFLEEELEFKNSIVSIMAYPILIAGVGVLTIFVLLKFVIPKLATIFEEIGQNLPIPTLILIKASDFLSKYWIFVLMLAVAIFFSAKRYLNHSSNRLKIDKLKFKLPGVGNLLRRIEVFRFSRALSVLLKNGVPLDLSLRVLTSTTENLYFKEEIEVIGEKIKEGSSLSESMENRNIFEPSFINVVTVGENSGKLGSVLESISNDYNKDVNRKLKLFLSTLEPLLILIVGLAVGFVVLSMLLPIFQMDFNF